MRNVASIPVVLLILAICLPAQADMLVAVDWGGDYFTGTSSKGFDGTNRVSESTGNYDANPALDFRYYVPFSMDAVLSPSSYSGTSSVFYGGYSLIKYNNTSPLATPNASILGAGGGGDSEAIQLRVVTGGGGESGGVLMWKKADFLNGANALSNVYLTGDTALSITIVDGGYTTGPGTFRMVVQNGTDYYISNSTASGLGTFTIADPTTETWAVYNPANSNNFFDDIGATFTTRTFDNVQALGYQVVNTQTGNFNSRVSDVNFQVSTVGATQIPEPATLALLALGGLMATGGALRRRKAVS
ncbi:MAG: hypothetical protein BIFFINMI_01534 [Phycisphaerae bacterium]|nr:hypothetical protein [Phycisphaerae bacterium]